MITVIIVSVCILGLFLLLTAILSINVDFRAVIDIDRNDFIVEAMLFRRFRILRFQIILVGGAFYIKSLKKPYRSVGYLTNHAEKASEAQAEAKKENKEQSDMGKKVDIGQVFNALTHHKLHLEQLRIYVNVGGDDSLATSMIWGGAETVAALALALSSRIIESDNVSVLVKPEFKSADFMADALIKVRIGSVLNALMAIIIAIRRANKRIHDTESVKQ